jgi:hypothetical protein
VGRAAAALLSAALLLALPAAASADTSATEAIRLFNAQRAANGLPGDIVENASWSSACFKHNDYQRQNDGLTHEEEPGKPGYTTEGRFAGQNSVLAQGSTWSQGNPWETAPIHLIQLLTPRLKSMGVDDRGGFVCATTWPGFAESGPAAPVIFTYPGDGRAGWRASEVAAEGPFTPGEKLGIPKDTRTGPYIYALLDGPGGFFDLRDKARLTTATLTGAQGPVALKTADSTNSALGPYMPPGAFIIPVDPLLGGTKYTASVTFDVGGTPVSKTWSFTTAGAAASLALSSSWPSTAKGRSVSGSVTCSRPCKLTIELSVKGKKKPIATKTLTVGSGGKVKVKLTIPRSAGTVKKATVKVSAKNLAGGRSPSPRSSTVAFSR